MFPLTGTSRAWHRCHVAFYDGCSGNLAGPPAVLESSGLPMMAGVAPLVIVAITLIAGGTSNLSAQEPAAAKARTRTPPRVFLWLQFEPTKNAPDAPLELRTCVVYQHFGHSKRLILAAAHDGSSNNGSYVVSPEQEPVVSADSFIDAYREQGRSVLEQTAPAVFGAFRFPPLNSEGGVAVPSGPQSAVTIVLSSDSSNRSRDVWFKRSEAEDLGVSKEVAAIIGVVNRCLESAGAGAEDRIPEGQCDCGRP